MQFCCWLCHPKLMNTFVVFFYAKWHHSCIVSPRSWFHRLVIRDSSFRPCANLTKNKATFQHCCSFKAIYIYVQICISLRLHMILAAVFRTKQPLEVVTPYKRLSSLALYTAVDSPVPGACGTAQNCCLVICIICCCSIPLTLCHCAALLIIAILKWIVLKSQT